MIRRIQGALAATVLLAGLSAPALGGDFCRSPFSEEDAQVLCRGLADDVNSNISSDLAVKKAVDFVLGKVSVGARGTFGENGCYEVSRIQIQLFYETEESAVIDSFSDLGDKSDREIIMVRSCQLGDRTEAEEEYASASVQIFLKDSKDVSLSMAADKTNLEPGENTTVNARLACGECGLKDETIFFSVFGAGEITPGTSLTKDDGTANVLFTMRDDMDTVITARHEDNTEDITISSLPILWSIDISMDHTNTYCRHMAPDWSKLRRVREVDWQYAVSFRDISMETGISRLQDFIRQNPTGASLPGQGAMPANLSAVWEVLGSYQSEGTITGKIRQLRVDVEKSPDAFYWARSLIQGSPICRLGFADASDETGNLLPDVIGFGLSLDYAEEVSEDGRKGTYHFSAGAGLSHQAIPKAKIREGKPFVLVFDNDWGDDCEKDWGAPKWHIVIRFTPQR